MRDPLTATPDRADRVTVVFLPAAIAVRVAPGMTVLEAARAAGVPLVAPCGGRGVCGACAVRVISGSLAPPDDHEERVLAGASATIRLACRARVTQDVEVRLVATVDASARTGPPPDTVRTLVAAVDLGSTTITASVFDAGTGREIGQATVPNAQTPWGSDIASRVTAAVEGDAALLQAAAEDSIVSAIRAACAKAGCDPHDVSRAVIVGNTVMCSLLLGLDLSALAAHPFIEPFTDIVRLPDDSPVSIALRGADTMVLPPVASFAGSDAVAGVWGAGLADLREPSLLIDAGTNAEIVLVRDGALTVATVPAGPAFEAANITSGGPAVPGAVREVRIGAGGDVTLSVIDGSAEGTTWLCGSGLVSAVSELVRTGHIGSDGRMAHEGPLESAFTRVSGVDAVRLAEGLLLTQNDIRAFQLAKGALRVGVERVLERAGVPCELLGRTALSGAFGDAVAVEDLVITGILPATLALRAQRAGNTALAGAALVAMDHTLADVMHAAARNAHHVSLADDDRFAASLMSALSF